MTDLLSALTQLASELGPLSNQLNTRIIEEEARLLATNLGVRGEIPMEDVFLAWVRAGQTWRFHIRFSDGKLEPLVNSTRELRMMAIAKFPALHQKLFENATALKASLENLTRAS